MRSPPQRAVRRNWRSDAKTSFRDAPSGAGPESMAPLEWLEKWILRCAIAHHSSRFACPGMTADLSPAELLGKRLDIDEATRVAALADPALVVERFDFEPDDPPLDRDHPRNRPHGRADRRRGEMADIDLGADRDPAGFEAGLDRIGGGELHLQNHHRRRVDHRHIRHEMPDR